MAKDFMNANNIKFTDYNVATDLEKRKEMVDKSGQMGVPVIDIDGDLMVGFEQDRLATALGIK
jgi:glutaredoxin